MFQNNRESEIPDETYHFRESTLRPSIRDSYIPDETDQYEEDKQSEEELFVEGEEILDESDAIPLDILGGNQLIMRPEIVQNEYLTGTKTLNDSFERESYCATDIRNFKSVARNFDVEGDEIQLQSRIRHEYQSPSFAEVQQVQNRNDENLKKMITKDKVQVFNHKSMPKKNNLVIKQLKQLGSGSQADIIKCKIHDIPGKLFVDKTKTIHNNEDLAEEVLIQMMREFMLATELDHPNIIQYHYFMKKFDQRSFQIHVLMELMEGGDLQAYLKQTKPSLQTVKEIGRQILSALTYLNDMGIIHQDLKPANIMFDRQQKQVKLIDFGVSSKVERTLHTKAAAQGTIRYMSPEQINGKLSPKSDVWAFGCVILELYTTIRPYNNLDNEIALSLQIFEGVSPLEDFETQNFNKSLLDTLKQCFEPNHKYRISTKDLLNKSFFQ